MLKHCINEGDKNDMKCLTCDSDKFFAEPNNCINKISNYYYSEEEKKYKKCYANCNECYENSSEINHNCKNCRDGYHFIYNEEGKCIELERKPLNTYLNIETNTFKKCYERCSTCDEAVNITNNNCNQCLKDDNNNYIYHFVYIEKGKCVASSEIVDFVYLDINDNTYKLSPEKTIKVENNKCFKKQKNYLFLIIITLILLIIIVAIFIIYFIKRYKYTKQPDISSINSIELVK